MRSLRVDYAGQQYQIPDIWLAGYCRKHGTSIPEAVEHWHKQMLLAEQWEGEAALIPARLQPNETRKENQ